MSWLLWLLGVCLALYALIIFALLRIIWRSRRSESLVEPLSEAQLERLDMNRWKP